MIWRCWVNTETLSSAEALQIAQMPAEAEQQWGAERFREPLLETHHISCSVQALEGEGGYNDKLTWSPPFLNFPSYFCIWLVCRKELTQQAPDYYSYSDYFGLLAFLQLASGWHLGTWTLGKKEYLIVPHLFVQTPWFMLYTCFSFWSLVFGCMLGRGCLYS